MKTKGGKAGGKMGGGRGAVAGLRVEVQDIP